MEEKKIVYVDMDGVLVDFESGKDAVGREKLAEWGGSPDNYPHIFSLMRPNDRFGFNHPLISV